MDIFTVGELVNMVDLSTVGNWLTMDLSRVIVRVAFRSPISITLSSL